MTKTVFKLSTKKKNEKSRYIIAKGNGLKLPIAEYGGEKKYYRPDGSKSMLRTKIKKFWYIYWDTKNLSKIFGTEISLWRHNIWDDSPRGKATVTNSSDLIRNVPLKEWAKDLNELANRLGVNIKFE